MEKQFTKTAIIPWTNHKADGSESFASSIGESDEEVLDHHLLETPNSEPVGFPK